MLKDYLNKLQEQRNNHPISSDEYDTWKHDKVTKRLLFDLEEALLSNIEDVGGDARSIESIAKNAILFGSARDTIELIKDWKPEELEADDA